MIVNGLQGKERVSKVKLRVNRRQVQQIKEEWWLIASDRAGTSLVTLLQTNVKGYGDNGESRAL